MTSRQPSRSATARPTRSRVRAGFAALATAALLAGCAAPSSVAIPTAGTARTPKPNGVVDPASAAPAPTGPTQDCTPSLRPAGSLPQPSVMPPGSAMAAIQSRGRLRVGVDQNTFLFGYRDPSSGEIVGFDIDMAKTIAKAIFGDANKVQFVAITSAQRIPYLRQGKVDLVVDTMTINCDRWKQVDFSTVYYNAGQRVLVPKNSTATGIADLGGKKVCAAAGSTSIGNIANAASHPIPVSVNDWTDCMVLLQQNQIAAISTDDTILRGLAAQDPNTKLVGAAFTEEPYGMAMSQDAPELVRFVNGVLEQSRQNGEWARIYARWLGTAPTPPAAKYRD